MEVKRIKVRWLLAHRDFAYSKGDVCELTAEHVAMLQKPEGDEETFQHYIEILPDGWEPPVVVQRVILDSERINVKWRKAHRDYAYSPGDIGTVLLERIPELSDGDDPFVEVLPADWKEPEPEKSDIPMKDPVKVQFLKYHPDFAYIVGDIALLRADMAEMLIKGGFAKRVTKASPDKKTILERLKTYIK